MATGAAEALKLLRERQDDAAAVLLGEVLLLAYTQGQRYERDSSRKSAAAPYPRTSSADFIQVAQEAIRRDRQAAMAAKMLMTSLLSHEPGCPEEGQENPWCGCLEKRIASKEDNRG